MLPLPLRHAHRRPGQRSPGFPLFLRLPGADSPLKQAAGTRAPSRSCLLSPLRFDTAVSHCVAAPAQHRPQLSASPLWGAFRWCGVRLQPEMTLALRPRHSDRGRAPCYPAARMAGPCSIPGHLAVSRSGCRLGEAVCVPSLMYFTSCRDRFRLSPSESAPCPRLLLDHPDRSHGPFRCHRCRRRPRRH